MALLIETFVAICLLNSLGTVCTAAFGRLYGLTIKELRFGWGPRVASIGRASFCVIPLSSSVKIVSIYDDDFSTSFGSRPYESLRTWKRIVFHLVGPAILIEIALLGGGTEGLEEFWSAFAEILHGALAPLSRAQIYLHDYGAFAQSHSFLAVFFVLSAKLAAINVLSLLPITTYYLSRYLSQLLGKPLHPNPKRVTPSVMTAIFGLIALYASWTGALAYAAWTTTW